MPEKKSEEKSQQAKQPQTKAESTLLSNAYEQEHSTQKCAIATAAYGTLLTLELDVLRNWRDDIEKGKLGKALANLYYKLSPPIAELIEQSGLARAAIRTALSPLVKILGESREYCRMPA